MGYIEYTIKHNGKTSSNKYIVSSSSGTIPISNGTVKTTISINSSKTLNCSKKVAKNNIIIGNNTLNCANKVMSDNIAITTGDYYIVEPQSSLEDYSWDNIKTLSDALVAGTITTSALSSTYNINIGSTKQSTLGGESHNYRIVDYLHDVNSSGTKLGMTFEQVETMNGNCWNQVVGSDTNFTNSPLYSTLSSMSIASDLNAVITAARKTIAVSANDGSATSYISKLWPMSEKEISGSTAYSKCSSEGSQYKYYANGNSKVKYQNGSARGYWTRTVYSATWQSQPQMVVQNHAYITSDGGDAQLYTNYGNPPSYVPCFCI